MPLLTLKIPNVHHRLRTRRQLMGMGMAGKKHATNISHRTLLFLFNISTKEMFGVYGATAAVGIDWVREAFGGRFPVQVRGSLFRSLVHDPQTGQDPDSMSPRSCCRQTPASRGRAKHPRPLLPRAGAFPNVHSGRPSSHLRLSARPHHEDEATVRAGPVSPAGAQRLVRLRIVESLEGACPRQRRPPKPLFLKGHRAPAQLCLSRQESLPLEVLTTPHPCRRRWP